jgi:hypothetical protein
VKELKHMGSPGLSLDPVCLLVSIIISWSLLYCFKLVVKVSLGGQLGQRREQIPKRRKLRRSMTALLLDTSVVTGCTTCGDF